jgi:isocitrate dehydrogenase
MKRITVAEGDGIGPEITEATLAILDAAGAPLAYDRIQIGMAAYRQGIESGVPASAWETIRRNGVLLKGPVTTPQGGGFKSVNVTIRKTLNLFANVRQSRAYAPFVPSAHPRMNLVIIRENEEDLYAGIEYRQTQEVTQAVKLVSRPGTERIVRYAFEHARAYGRRQVTCMTKDNIMKQSDGLFHRVFDEVAAEYPEIESEHQIIDIGAARLAAIPERSDVIVTLNLYGDILSDIAAQIAGSVGLAGSANVGVACAMFEAVHGSAPDIAGKGIANPSGLLVAATQMLVHMNEPEIAERIKNAWLCALEDGMHTADVYREGISRQLVGTHEFSRAVIERLGMAPRILEPVRYRSGDIAVKVVPAAAEPKALTGVDLYLEWDEPGRDADALGARMEALSGNGLALRVISNRGVKVYPEGAPETFRSDMWRCRYMASGDALGFEQVLDLLARANAAGLDVVKTEHLYTFSGRRGYSLDQGE